MAQTKGPEFPGGDEMLKQFLKENTRYPYKTKDRRNYDVQAEVLVTEDGTAKLHKILKRENLQNEIVKEVRRVIKLMPKWTPGGSYATDGTFVPEQWMTRINVNFNPANVLDPDVICVNVSKAGSLSTLLTPEQKRTCAKLMILGSINSEDIITISEMAGEEGSLEYLDLSSVRIKTSKMPYLQLMDAEKFLSYYSYNVEDKPRDTPNWIGLSYQVPHPGGSYMNLKPYTETVRDTPTSYKERRLAIYEGETNGIAQSHNLKSRKFKGHKLEHNGDTFIFTAYTTKDSFCEDMFYRCPKLKQVVVPYHASVNELSSLADSNIKFVIR